jgi:hypothetical protein
LSAYRFYILVDCVDCDGTFLFRQQNERNLLRYNGMKNEGVIFKKINDHSRMLRHSLNEQLIENNRNCSYQCLYCDIIWQFKLFLKNNCWCYYCLLITRNETHLGAITPTKNIERLFRLKVVLVTIKSILHRRLKLVAEKVLAWTLELETCALRCISKKLLIQITSCFLNESRCLIEDQRTWKWSIMYS